MVGADAETTKGRPVDVVVGAEAETTRIAPRENGFGRTACRGDRESFVIVRIGVVKGI